MTAGNQRRKRAALLLSLSLVVVLGLLPFGRFSGSLTTKLDVSSKQEDYTSFLVPSVPDSLPTEMLNRALVPKNEMLLIPTNVTASCPVTSQVRLIQQDHQHWILRSLDIDGKLKTVGGDEYYVTYTDNSMVTTPRNSPTAVAFVHDRRDGSYRLRFVNSPTLNTSVATGTGKVTIVLQYSCGVGHLAPPSKANWSRGGAINAKYIVENVTAPFMETFVPPHGIDLGQYDRVVAYGDSTMGGFIGYNKSSPEELFGRNLIWPVGNVGAPLNTDTIKNPREVNGKVSPSIITQITNAVKHTRMRFERVALLVSSGVWDILADEEGRQGPQFHDHREACRQLIAAIRKEFPTLDLYWRSHTAMHIHRVADRKNWFFLDRVFYMSSSRSHDLYRFQKEIMAELNVTFLDLYPATYLSAEQLGKHDGRHYSPAFNQKMLSWFYKD